jgi:hypothetical protein
MKIILAIMAILYSSSAYAQIFAKPVHCSDTLETLIPVWEKEEVFPLLALGGNSWTDDGSTIPSVMYIVVNADGRNAIVERTGTGFCLLSSGSVVEYNPDKIKEMMEWE